MLALLKKTNVDFSAANYRGKSVGGLPADTLGGVMRYTNEVERLNKVLGGTVIKPSFPTPLQKRLSA